SLVFFFFQAEDGIRDRNVTGVQTCALPIFTLLLRQSHEICNQWLKLPPVADNAITHYLKSRDHKDFPSWHFFQHLVHSKSVSIGRMGTQSPISRCQSSPENYAALHCTKS